MGGFMHEELSLLDFIKQAKFLEDIILELTKDLMSKLNNHPNINMFVKDDQLMVAFVLDTHVVEVKYTELVPTLLEIEKAMSIVMANQYVEYHKRNEGEYGDNGITN